MGPLASVSRIALALAAVHLVVGLAMSLIGNPEGPLGGGLYAVLYALPLLLIGLALRSSRHGLWTAAGWGALVLAAFYVMTVTGNWTFYSTQEAVFAAGVTIPTVAVDVAVVWVTLRHRPGHTTPSAPTAG